jgi:hypothetical protein
VENFSDKLKGISVKQQIQNHMDSFRIGIRVSVEIIFGGIILGPSITFPTRSPVVTTFETSNPIPTTKSITKGK